MIALGGIDVILLLALAFVTLIASIRKERWVRVLAVAVLLATIVFSQLSLEPLLRSVVVERHNKGQWSADFVAGAREMTDYLCDYRPYVILSAFGLAAIALRRFSKGP